MRFIEQQCRRIIFIAVVICVTACGQGDQPEATPPIEPSPATVMGATEAEGAAATAGDTAASATAADANATVVAAAAPASASSIEADIIVDVMGDIRPISPYIYGMAGPSAEYMAEANITLLNWGGNANTRYNWKLGNAWNAASDWLYINGDYGYTGPSASDDFLRLNSSLGIASRLTIPTIGWVAKDTSSCSFPNADGSCGDAQQANCSSPGAIADPFQTSVEAPPSYMTEWLQHITGNLGLYPEFLAMDNESDLWGITHYDVHPECTTYDEMFERYVMYAEPLKAVSPTSQIVGPNSCCWWFYWNSMAGDADKVAHGGVDFLPWFLQQMQRYEAEKGQRLLDVLDIHYYPEGIYNDDASPEVAAHRLRAPRSLWDPSYVDESWIGEAVYLIPRMKALIEAHYPGTKLGFSEWNFGADSSMNGAVTIADVLGIYGREELYYASYWEHPEYQSPGFYAFKMYTNFDGQGHRFGDLSIRLESPDPDRIGSYAALDSATGNLHVMLINKQPEQAETLSVGLLGFTATTSAALYQYDGTQSSGIVQSQVQMADSLLNVTLPPYSISLFVLQPE